MRDRNHGEAHSKEDSPEILCLERPVGCSYGGRPSAHKRGEDEHRPMSAYRMYFRTTGQICGREDFEADDDVAAIRIARVLYDTCSDICDCFELWQGKRQIRAQQPHHQKANFADLIEKHQGVALESVERISQSRWMIAQSRRLIGTLDHSKSAKTCQ